MSQITANAKPCDRTCAIAPSAVRADELAEGDIIKHFTGDVWMVINEPEYTNAGITFEVMWHCSTRVWLR